MLSRLELDWAASDWLWTRDYTIDLWDEASGTWVRAVDGQHNLAPAAVHNIVPTASDRVIPAFHTPTLG